MHHALNFRQILTGFFLLGVTLGCGALSLGSAQGTVWLGQPIDLRIQIKINPGDDAAALCFTANLFHADARVSGEQVRLSIEPGGSADEVSLRLRSAALVDEPVVTIVLKAGCVQPVTRRYVLLADVPADGAILPPMPEADARPQVDTKTHKNPVRPSAPRLANQSTTASAAVAPAPVASAPVVASIVRTQRSGRLGVKPHLKLDPLKFTVERELVLRSSTELLTLPTQDASERAQAAALWRAINAAPEDILLTVRQFQSLQSEATALKMQNQKNEAAVADLAARQQSALTERYSGALVFGLLVALVAAAGAAAYFWRARRDLRQPPWWQAGRDPVDELETNAGLARTTNPMAPSATRGAPGAVNLHTAATMPSEGSGQERAAGASTSGPNAMAGAHFQTRLTESNRAVKMDELLDIQQQADFYISFDQHDQAVAILQNYLTKTTDTPALIYLDLLSLYHLQGREPDYDLVRQQFSQNFVAQIPEFSDFGQWSRDLESYQSALSQIVVLWPSENVLYFIEELMFQKPGQDNPVFTLAAYRELLLLYVIAREVIHSGVGRDS
ncbi:MAG: hypothetical protein AUJ20_05855 [Comamonadaceae bacterium CG1_02_60_18]|nr:MAG: hypothetical protein AUJ20_05855 [Comamonadaceae bacterium CG1_02_60_18]PIQ56772.1 MAG: hypothetical protein COW02_00180 [Comamonadaceae bacterium CG12_big_fil_rev_8_21_14_0_65_59_15]